MAHRAMKTVLSVEELGIDHLSYSNDVMIHNIVLLAISSVIRQLNYSDWMNQIRIIRTHFFEFNVYNFGEI